MPKRPIDVQKQNQVVEKQAGPASTTSNAPSTALTRFVDRPNPRGEVIPPRPQVSRPYVQRPFRPRPQNPFKCSYCGNLGIEAFANVYSRGSSQSKSKSGVILKLRRTDTRKQSVLAIRCTPPKKKGIVRWLVLSGFGLVCLHYVPSVVLGVEIPTSTTSVLMIISGILGVAYGVLWNRMQHPKEMERWDNSFYCRRCAKVTIITPTA
jgi:hypothetical protein